MATDTGLTTLKLDVDTPLMMMRGLSALVPGFDESLRSLEVPINIISANTKSTAKNPSKRVKGYSPKGLKDDFNKHDEIHVVPAVEGAGLEIVAWYVGTSVAALTVAQIAIGIVISLAISLVVGAVAQMLAPKPSTSAGAQSVDQRPSFIFNGPVNISAQGYAIPLVYGTCLVGSTVISSGYDTVDIM